MTPGIAIHLAAALAALPLGGWILARPKGTPAHRAAGRAWAGLMLMVAISSLWIPHFLQFSGIHLLTLVTLFFVPAGFLAIRAGNRRAHRRCMVGTYLGLVGAGVYALAPDRLAGAALWSVLGLR